jgi:superfamily II DNA or RNA helicase
LTNGPELLRARVRKQSDQVRGQQAYARMRTTPVADLRRVTTRSLKLEELENVGCSTVLDVLHATAEDLQRVKGVGPQGAAALRQAADDLLARTERELTVRIDPDARTQDTEDLLRNLRMLLDFTRASRSARSAAAALDARLPETLRRAEPARSWWRLLVARGRTRADVATALEELQRWVDGPTDALVREAAAQAVGAARAAEGLAPRRLWSEFQRNAASYTTLLAEVERSGPDGQSQAELGFVSDEIAEEAGGVALDTSLLKVRLRTYQAFGAKFILARQRCVLGDEMGLGKTVQAIAVLAHTAAAAGGRHFLVVCPASVLVNWMGEVGCHSELTAYQAHGAGRDTAAARWLAMGGVAVTTFETLRRLPLPDGFRPDFMIVDEAHYIKNPEAQRTQVVTAVAERARGVLMMTGTPLENRVEEFRDLVSYLDPEIAAAITARDGVLGAREFRKRVAPVYLRRNQEDVLSELPELIELEDWVALGEEDERAYSVAVGAGNFTAMRRATVVNRTDVLSAKLERLIDIVEESAASGWKVIIFSFFLDVLSEVDDVIHRTLPEVPTFQLSGRVPAAQRQQIVDELSAVEGPAVLISQITAGGVGLNVQAASVVIMTEPQLKPTIEQQAIARCHRMGQTRRVRVHRLLAKDTVDERLLEILGTKSELIEAYARDSEAKLLDPAAVDGSLAIDLASPARGSGQPDVSENQLKQRIVDLERRRLGCRPT